MGNDFNDIETHTSKYIGGDKTAQKYANFSERCFNQTFFILHCLSVFLVGQTNFWNLGLEAGFGNFIIACILVGLAYVCQSMSLCEMSSALPFAGGSFTLVRCSVGFYAGFLTGYCQLFMYIGLSSFVTYSVSNCIATVLSLSTHIEPLIMLSILVIACTINLLSDKMRSVITMLCGTVGMVSVAIFLIASWPHSDLSTYGRYNSDREGVWFVGGASEFMRRLPNALWFFIGMELLSSKSTIHQSSAEGISKVFGIFGIYSLLMALCILCTCSAIGPGVYLLSQERYPLSYVYNSSFHENTAFFKVIMIIIQITGLVHINYKSGLLIDTIAASKLLPMAYMCRHSVHNHLSKGFEAFQLRLQLFYGSFYGFILTTTLSFVVSCIIWSSPRLASNLERSVLFAMLVVNILVCVAYRRQRMKFTNINRLFVSPSGIVGASFSMIMFACVAIGVMGFSNDNGAAAVIVVIYIGVISLYYYAYAVRHQQLTDEEMKLTFSSLVVKFNNRSQNYVKKGYSSAAAKSSRQEISDMRHSFSIMSIVRSRKSIRPETAASDRPLSAQASAMTSTRAPPGKFARDVSKSPDATLKELAEAFIKQHQSSGASNTSENVNYTDALANLPGRETNRMENIAE